MADPTPNSPPAPNAGDPPAPGPGVVPAAPTLLATPPQPDPGAPPPVQQTPEEKAAADVAAAESKTRTDAFAAATDKDGKLAAWEKLSKDERVAAFKGMSDEAKKELGVADPARPTYTDFKLPDGLKLDPERAKAATELFADSGLSQEQAQKFMDMHVAEVTAAAGKGAKDFVDLQNKWVSEVKADPEIGGDKLTASLADSSRAIDRLGGPDLRAALDLTGAGNNPAIVKAFVRMGQMIKEDKFAPGNPAAPTPPGSVAERLYAGQPKGSVDA